MDVPPEFLPLFLCLGLVMTAGSTIGILMLCSCYFYNSSLTFLNCWWALGSNQEKEFGAANDVFYILRNIRPKTDDTFYGIDD